MDAQQKEEYQQWKGYAHALLLALTVLFAATLIIDPKAGMSIYIFPIIFGLAGIVLTVLWFAFDTKRQMRGKPIYLWWATCSFSAQVVTLFAALLVVYLCSSTSPLYKGIIYLLTPIG